MGDGHLDHKKAVRLHTSPVINPIVNPNKIQSRAAAQGKILKHMMAFGSMNIFIASANTSYQICIQT